MFLRKATTFVITIVLTILLTSSNITYAAPTPQKIPTGIIETAKKIGLWRDIYLTQQKVVVYSYIKGSTCPYQSQSFHEDIRDAALNSEGAYKARPTGPDRMQKEVENIISKLNAESQNINSQEDASEFNKKINDFNKLVEFTNKCTVQACIINPSKGEYILLNRKSAEVLQVMKQY